MKIHLLSDIHAEIHAESREFSPAPAAARVDVVVLAGDVHSQGRSVQWALDAFSVPIVMVAGNHEFYGTEIESTQRRFAQDAAASRGRLHYLERQSVVIDGVRFLGATAWTDFQFGGNAPLAKLEADRRMNDYRSIRKGRDQHRLRPDDTERFAQASRRWIEAELSTPFDGKTVLVTHHPIIARSLDPAKRPRLLDAAYCNTWDHLLFEPFHALCLAVHGHTHHAVDYVVNQTRVVSNPVGYPGERTGYQADLVIEV